MKPYILIVEDEAILYDGLSQALIKHRFKVSDYTPSYQKAIERIKEEKPDIALLDIDLQGEKDGLDLGKELHNKYGIPFIYITSLDDEHIFQKGLRTHHEQFIVKTKPNLNIREVIRAVETVCNRKLESETEQQSIWAFEIDLNSPRSIQAEQIRESAVHFSDIAYFSSERWLADKEVPRNYTWFTTSEKKIFIIRKSLKELLEICPEYIVQINGSYLVNISDSFLQGRKNCSAIYILDQEIKITRTFKKQFKNKLGIE